MKTQVKAIRLNHDLTVVRDSSLVKRGALSVFRVMRSVVAHSKEVPGIMQQAADDIRTAWEESSRPNA